MSFVRLVIVLITFLTLTGCENAADNMLPSSEDKRPVVEQGVPGTSVGQIALDFTIPDTLNNPVTMSNELVGSDGVVLYFTMWCPVCDSHMSHMRAHIIPNYPNIKFFFIDYVSGSVTIARSAQISNGYTGTSYSVLVDTDQSVLTAYRGTMGTAVVIDASGIVQMNEDYKDGTKINSILENL